MTTALDRLRSLYWPVVFEGMCVTTLIHAQDEAMEHYHRYLRTLGRFPPPALPETRVLDFFASDGG